MGAGRYHPSACAPWHAGVQRRNGSKAVLLRQLPLLRRLGFLCAGGGFHRSDELERLVGDRVRLRFDYWTNIRLWRSSASVTRRGSRIHRRLSPFKRGFPDTAASRSASWSRSLWTSARDCYDLWRVFGSYGDRMEWADFDMLFREKCAVRDVSFTGSNDFSDERMLVKVEETWEQWLGPLASDLPAFKTVIGAVHPRVAKLVPAVST